MSTRRFVTIRSEGSNQEFLVEVPGDQPLREWMPDLIKTLDFQVDAGSECYQIRVESGNLLSDEKTLLQAGVDNSDILWITKIPGDSFAASNVDLAEKSTSMTQNVGEESSAHLESFGINEVGQSTLPLSEQIKVTEPALVSEKGYVFVLPDPPVTIGRRTPTTQPNIDVTPLDKDHIVSRLHAEILFDEQNYFLKSSGAKNGTFLNNVELKPDEKRIIRDRDVILLGFRGVELVFRLPA